MGSYNDEDLSSAPLFQSPCPSRALDQVDPEVSPDLSHHPVNLGLFAGSWEQGGRKRMSWSWSLGSSGFVCL